MRFVEIPYLGYLDRQVMAVIHYVERSLSGVRLPSATLRLSSFAIATHRFAMSVEMVSNSRFLTMNDRSERLEFMMNLLG